MDTLIIVLQVMLSLSILVILHEGGHFMTAKWFQARVEKFYLFFNPWFSLFKFKKGETEYGIGWLPLGGYVKISGMIDESFDKEQLQGEVQPWEFRSKPAWQRLIIMLGGIIVNVILGITIFIFIFWLNGSSYVTNESIKDGIYVDSLGYQIGLRDGDKIMKVGEADFIKFDKGELVRALVIDGASTITVERSGKEQVLQVETSSVQELSKYKNRKSEIFGPRLPFVINEVAKNTPAEEAGMQAGDRVIGMDSIQTLFTHEVLKTLDLAKNKRVDFTVLRADTDTIKLAATIGEDGILGVTREFEKFIQLETEKYSFLEAVPLGFKESYTFLADQLKAFGKMFTGELKAKDSLGSIISIGKMFGTEWDWLRFWNLTAMLSILLAFLNLLPIPGLDGGHVVFVIWEMITGKKASDKVVEYATLVGFILLVGLMIFAFGLDILRLFE
ncbi:MAG TPA: RIP metalloprotease RseP [Saprospirales bacterium]|nr:RIP metalloprotease RseP [Saprospirales bacterium]